MPTILQQVKLMMNNFQNYKNMRETISWKNKNLVMENVHDPSVSMVNPDTGNLEAWLPSFPCSPFPEGIPHCLLDPFLLLDELSDAFSFSRGHLFLGLK